MEKGDLNRVPTGAWERLALVPAKLRARGTGWLTKRLRQEAVTFARRSLPLIARLQRRFARVFFSPWLAKDTLFAMYDLEHYPITYDILWFLVWADIQRRNQGLPQMQCVFIPFRDGKAEKERLREGYDAVVDANSRAWRFQNICVSATTLIPGCGVTVNANRDMADDLALIARKMAPLISPPLAAIYRQTIAGLAAQGSEWHGLTASPQGLRYMEQWLETEAGNRKPVVITLRQYGYDVTRNSALEEWAAFAHSLDPDIYCPIIIPDTDNAMVPVPGFEGLSSFPQAAWNVGLRMALYQLAYLNMFVNCGPGSLCMLNRQCRYLFFKVMAPTHLALEESLRELGFERNTNPAFATPFQKWVWESDNRAILHREFDAMVDRIEGKAAQSRTGT